VLEEPIENLFELKELLPYIYIFVMTLDFLSILLRIFFIIICYEFILMKKEFIIYLFLNFIL
jgi:hypothetical protein